MAQLISKQLIEINVLIILPVKGILNVPVDVKRHFAEVFRFPVQLRVRKKIEEMRQINGGAASGLLQDLSKKLSILSES